MQICRLISTAAFFLIRFSPDGSSAPDKGSLPVMVSHEAASPRKAKQVLACSLNPKYSTSVPGYLCRVTQTLSLKTIQSGPHAPPPPLPIPHASGSPASSATTVLTAVSGSSPPSMSLSKILGMPTILLRSSMACPVMVER